VRARFPGALTVLKALIITVVLLFPWSLIIVAVLAAFARRRAATRMLRAVARPEHPELYIPPRSGEPMLLDSASIAKQMRETKQ
jgi:hypothetical protein